MSSFSGRIEEYPDIAVDRFDGKNLTARAFFLSHLHVDHMVGLTSSDFLYKLQSDKRLKLYAHPFTCKLLATDPELKHLAKYCQALEEDTTHTVAIPHSETEREHILNVTVVSAKHIVGSAMFLFDGGNGRVLYTGDCRFPVGSALELHKLLPVNHLYIDTTFCTESPSKFPSKEQSANTTTDLIREWISQGSSKKAVLQYNAKLGCEFIYERVSDSFSSKIYFGAEKHHLYQTLWGQDNFSTSDPQSTQIHACARNSKCCDGENVRRIILSTMAFVEQDYKSNKFVKRMKGNTFRVCYSIHSSLEELKAFILYVKPTQITPTVVSASTRSFIDKTLKELLREVHKNDLTYDPDWRPLSRPTLKRCMEPQTLSCRARKRLKREERNEPESSDSDLDFGDPKELNG